MDHWTCALEAGSQVAALRQVLSVKCVVVMAEALKVRANPKDGYGDDGQDKADNFWWLRGVCLYRIEPEESDGIRRLERITDRRRIVFGL